MKNPSAIVVSLCLALSAFFPLVNAEQVVIREINYHPSDGEDEWIVLENITYTPFDIVNWKVRGGVNFDFPDFDPSSRATRNNTIFSHLSKIIICGMDPEAFRAKYNISSRVKVYGPWTGMLANDGESVRVEDKNGVTMCEVSYGDRHPWPVAADGTGHVLLLANHNRSIDDYRLWTVSSSPTSAPASAQPLTNPSPLSINEVHFDAQGNIDWVEIYNAGENTVPTSGLSISSKRDFSDKVALDSSVPGKGFASRDVSFPAAGNQWVLFLVNNSGVVQDAVHFARVPGRDHAAAYPDGSSDFLSSVPGSRDAANDPTRESNIVINEIMAEPPTDHRDGEFIELYNKGTAAVDLSLWRFVDGVNFTFPQATVLNAGEYLVIASNRKFTEDAHPAARVIGEYSGSLSNRGELLRLVDKFGNVADEVHYQTGGDWEELTAGMGSSLELRHPTMDNTQATAWAASDESQKSTWQEFSFTERFEQIRTAGSTTDWKELHMHGVGDAHLALRSLSLRDRGQGTNFLPADGLRISTSGNGAGGWLCQGNHHLSYSENSEFHLVSTGHGDMKANRVETDIPNLQNGQALEFKCEARWIYGQPTLLVQTWDYSFGGVLRLPIPKNLGTPGAPNSALLADPVPTVTELRHSPVVPRSSDPVKVTARVTSAVGPLTVTLQHRPDSVDGSGAWNSAAMFDDGAGGGDAVANDGIYTAQLNPRADHSIVQFYVQAASPGGETILPRAASAEWTRFHRNRTIPDAHLKPAMYIVDNTVVPSDLRRERFIVSARSLDALTTNGNSDQGNGTFNYAFPRLSNQFWPCTFISDESEIIYNCEIRKAGSPWQRSPSGHLLTQNGQKTAKWKTPGDQRFRGWARRSVDEDPKVGRPYHNRLARYWLYLLGHPSNENEFVRFIVNGNNPHLLEEAETNNNDFLSRIWKDGQKGELYRIDDRWWFPDAWEPRGQENGDWRYWGASSDNEPERYHRDWMKRSREAEYDYSSYIAWVKAVGQGSPNNPNFTREQIERMADIDMMCANAVVRGWIADWDTLTLNRGKNGYFHRRYSDGKFMLLQWDSDLTYGNTGENFVGGLTGVQNFFNQPYVRQRFNAYLREMMDKYTQDSPRLEAWFEAEDAATLSAVPRNFGSYRNWNSGRRNRANTELNMGGALNSVFNITSGNGNRVDTSDDTIDLEGTIQSDVFSLRVVDHPEAKCRFESQTVFLITGIQLKEGANTLVVEGLDRQGNPLPRARDTISAVKSGNARPVISIKTTPDSLNVAQFDTLVMDASLSYDPEGTPLTFEWSVDKPEATLRNPTPGTATVTFATPGLYTISLTLTDGDGQSQTATREAVVYATSGWSSFSDSTLENWWTEENIEVRNDYSGGAWYSLDDLPNRLTLKVNDDSRKPPTMSNPSHPVLWRSVPASGNAILQTDLRLASVQQGDFITGLLLNVDENGTPTRYLFGIEDGDFLRVKKATGSIYTQLVSIDWTDEEAVLRIRREGDQLVFSYRNKPGIWTTVHAVDLPAGSLLGEGGIFAATDTPQQVRVQFDYVLVADPGTTPGDFGALRITELMYHPLTGSELEFIELMNTGTSVLNLNGVKFESGQPFVSEFVFGDVTLAAGEVAVIVADTAAFQAEYGGGIRILGQWTDGSLSNDGERIVLSDPLGNTIQNFRYDDQLPWPIAADGDGPSLEVIDTAGNYDDPANWMASAVNGGTPGVVNSGDLDGDGLSDADEILLGTNPLNPDTDGDGTLDGAEVAAGTDPLDLKSVFRIKQLTRESGSVQATWFSVPGRTYTLQSSPDLSVGSWTDVLTKVATGPETSATDPGAAAAERYYRVLVE